MFTKKCDLLPFSSKKVLKSLVKDEFFPAFRYSFCIIALLVSNILGLKVKSFKELNETYPERIIEDAVKGMLPKNKLGKSIIKKLKVFGGPVHSHDSQQPTVWNPKI